ncbi:MAG: SIMPL domain-containing protein [Candidatus Kuenenbacteria bacterium]
MDKQKFFLRLLGVLCLSAIIILALTFLWKSPASPQYFSATATGRIFAKPDIANLTFGFQTEIKKTAVQAVDENSTKMNNIINSLKDLGIEAKDIKTTNYGLNPIYDWTDNRDRQLKGYQANQNVTVKIRDLDKIGEAIARTAEQGANQVGNISFSIDDEDELKAKARDEAIVKAKDKAKDIAKTAGMKLGKIINVYENQANYPSPMYSSDMAFGMGGAEKIEAPSIETGENEVTVEVTLVYEVK